MNNFFKIILILVGGFILEYFQLKTQKSQKVMLKLKKKLWDAIKIGDSIYFDHSTDFNHSTYFNRKLNV